jgi:hypothetical protein
MDWLRAEARSGRISGSWATPGQARGFVDACLDWHRALPPKNRRRIRGDWLATCRNWVRGEVKRPPARASAYQREAGGNLVARRGGPEMPQEPREGPGETIPLGQVFGELARKWRSPAPRVEDPDEPADDGWGNEFPARYRDRLERDRGGKWQDWSAPLDGEEVIWSVLLC